MSSCFLILQRLRDQIKTWLNRDQNEIRDKSPLIDNRKKIENVRRKVVSGVKLMHLE